MTDTTQATDQNAVADARGGTVSDTAANPTATAPADANTTTDNAAHDLQAQIDAALTKQQAELALQFLQATGHPDVQTLIDAHRQEKSQLQALADGYKTKFEQAQIHSAILGECAEAISPPIVRDLLTIKAVCDENGGVTIDGRPVADAVKKLLADNPFMAKAQGGAGSGAASSIPVFGQAAKTMSRGDFDRMPPGKRQEFIHNGGTITG